MYQAYWHQKRRTVTLYDFIIVKLTGMKLICMKMNVYEKMIAFILLTCCCQLLIYLLSKTSKHYGELTCKTTEHDVSTCLYDLQIIVIVYNRSKSLIRLLKSLNDADYSIDKVKLEVWIDRSVNGEIDQFTLQTANNFTFQHGHYSVEVHTTHVGILGQWISTWKPNENSSEIAVILEDDLTVSPYFYKYLKLVHKMYDNSPEINGYALQGYSIKHHIKDSRPLKGPKDSLVFLYPVIGSWGFSPSRTNWMNFVNWCNTSVQNTSMQPYVPDNIATAWYKMFQQQGTSDSMWTIWHIYYAWKHHEFTLYPNFKDHTGLTTNWQEKGLHESGKNRGPTNRLLTEWKTEYERFPLNPLHLDIKGRII